MELKNMSKEEIELMSYTDLTYLLIKENKSAMSTASLFKRICELLGMDDQDYSAKIGDYYTSLTIDKRFYMLDSAEWDLSENHKVELHIDDDESEVDEVDETDESDEIDDEGDDLTDVDDDMDDVDDDSLDLSIVDEDDLNDEN